MTFDLSSQQNPSVFASFSSSLCSEKLNDSVWENCTLAGDAVANLQRVFLHTCFLDCLQTMAFYLFSFSNGVSLACRPRLVLSSRLSLFSFSHRRFFSSQSQQRKRAPATPRPQSHLRQMKQPLASSSSSSLSSLLFSSVPLLPLLLMTSLCRP